MTSTTDGQRRRPLGRLGPTVLGMLGGAAVGGVCALGLGLAYSAIFSISADEGFGDIVFRVFVTAGLGAGALCGAAMGRRIASRTGKVLPTSSTEISVGQGDLLVRLCWAVLGLSSGGVLFGAVAFGLGLAYFNLFPVTPDEGTPGYALFLVILPAGIAIGSILGAAIGWARSAKPLQGKTGEEIMPSPEP